MHIGWPNGSSQEISDQVYAKLLHQLDNGLADPPVPADWTGDAARWLAGVREVFGLHPDSFNPTHKSLTTSTCPHGDHLWGTPDATVKGVDERGIPYHTSCVCSKQAPVIARIRATWHEMDGCRRIRKPLLASSVGANLVVQGSVPLVAAHVRAAFIQSGNNVEDRLRVDWLVTTLPELKESSRAKSFESTDKPTKVDADADAEPVTTRTLPSLHSFVSSPDLVIILANNSLLKQEKFSDLLAESLAARSGRNHRPTWIVTSTDEQTTRAAEVSSFPTLILPVSK